MIKFTKYSAENFTLTWIFEMLSSY